MQLLPAVLQSPPAWASTGLPRAQPPTMRLSLAVLQGSTSLYKASSSMSIPVHTCASVHSTYTAYAFTTAAPWPFMACACATNSSAVWLPLPLCR